MATGKLFQRASAIFLVLLVLAAGAGADAPAARVESSVDTLAASLGLDAEAIVPPPASPWKLVEGAARTTLQIGRLAPGAEANYSLLVSGITVFGFEARGFQGGQIEWALDGVRQGRVEGAMDLALDGGPHTLTWTFRARAADSEATLVLAGPVALRVPTVVSVPNVLQGCVLPSARIEIVHVAKLDSRDLRVTWDGRPVEWAIDARLDGLTLRQTLRFDPPPVEVGQSRHQLNVTYVDDTGTARTLVAKAVEVLHMLGVLHGPRGWVYDLQPTVWLFHPCLLSEVSDVRLYVDGVDVTPRNFTLMPTYRFENELPYKEEHSYRYELTLRNGRTFSFGGTFREGFDVLEFNVTRGALKSTSFGATVSFGNPFAPDEMPLVKATLTGAVTPPSFLRVLPEGAHMKAVYAPHVLTCAVALGIKACSPYGVRDPKFYASADMATLTVTPQGEDAFTVPAAGQLAAASRFSRLDAPALPVVDARLEAVAEAKLDLLAKLR